MGIRNPFSPPTDSKGERLDATQLVDIGLGEAYEIVKEVGNRINQIAALAELATNIDILANNIESLTDYAKITDLGAYSLVGHTHTQYALTEHNHDGSYAQINHTHIGFAPTNHNHNGVYAPTIHHHDAAYAAKDHNHAGDYALTEHSHDTMYSPLVHNHNGLYAGISHDHNGAYSLITHNHNSAYAAIAHTHSDYITDAPNDGKQYVREGLGWVEVDISEPVDTGIPEAPVDGQAYARWMGQWLGLPNLEYFVIEAPIDGLYYTRRNAQWVEIDLDNLGGSGIEEAPMDSSLYGRINGYWGQIPTAVSSFGFTYTHAHDGAINAFDGRKRLIVKGTGFTASTYSVPELTAEIEFHIPELPSYAGNENRVLGLNSNADGLMWLDQMPGADGVEEAPEDGTAYVRKNGEWVPAPSGSGGSSGSSSSGNEVGAHRFWMLTNWTHHEGSDGIVGGAEVVLRPEQNGIDLTIEDASSSDSLYGYPPTNMIDLDPNTLWASINDSNPQLILDLGSDYPVKEIEWLARNDDWWRQAPRGFDVYYSDDTEIWGFAGRTVFNAFTDRGQSRIGRL